MDLLLQFGQYLPTFVMYIDKAISKPRLELAQLDADRRQDADVGRTFD